MPNIKSAIKRVEVSKKKTAANKTKKSEVKTAIKKATAAVKAGEGSAELVSKTQKTVDQAAAKGLMSKQAAGRVKSRIAKAANAAK